MSNYTPLDGEGLDEMIALLPEEKRDHYRRLFHPIVGGLVWLEEDAEAAVTSQLEFCAEEGNSPEGAPRDARLAARAALAEAWLNEPDRIERIAADLVDWEFEWATEKVNEALSDAAWDILKREMDEVITASKQEEEKAA